jgi:outer membrane lipoprotein-sorting protein
MKTIIAVFAFFLCAEPTSGVAQTLTASQILANVQKQFEQVNDYTVTLHATVNIEHLNIPDMTVKLYFKQPDKIHVESKNFAMLPKEGITLTPSLLIAKFDATLVETVQGGSGKIYKLHLISKPEPGKLTIESYVWVDGATWTITRFETIPAASRRISIAFDDTLIEGKYFLPKKITATFGSPETDTATVPFPESKFSQHMPRKGDVTILYSGYQVNTGLPDEIFQKDQDKR